MTKNRAQKQAARERAAATGERYVVARREVAQQLPPLPTEPTGLHALTHRMPGVPAHVDGGLQAAAPRSRKAAAQRAHASGHQGRANRGEPRVLVVWQERIARLLGAN